MFETLIASSPQACSSASRHLLSLSLHGIVVAGAVAMANFLEGATLQSGSRLRLPGIGPDDGGRATAEPLTAASVDDPVAVIEQPAPRYPSALERAGIAGHVVLEYVVDTTGHVEPGSLRTPVSTQPAFEAAAHVTVLASRYRPARLGGRFVRQLVRQTLTFRVGR
jgi:TonB family protein